MNRESTEPKLRLGIIGAGQSLQFHVPALKANADRYSIVGIASRSQDSAMKKAELYEIPQAYNSVEEMLEQTNCDLILVTVPVVVAESVGHTVLQSGIGLVLDKPVSVNAQAGRALLKQAQKKDVFASVAESTKFSATLQELREILRSDAIGTVRHIEISSYRAIDPAMLKPWRLRDDYCGWALEAGVHLVSTLRFLGGEVSQVCGVCITTAPFIGRCNTLYLTGITERDISFSLSLKRDIGKSFARHYQGCIIGESGRIEFSWGNIQLFCSAGNLKFQMMFPDEQEYHFMYQMMHLDFYRHSDSSIGLADGVRDLEVFEKAFPETYSGISEEHYYQH